VKNRVHEQWLKTHSDRHPAREILLVFEGAALNSLGRRIFPATPGTIFLFDAYEEHDRAYPREMDKAVHLWLYFGQHRIIARLLSISCGRVEYRRKMLVLEDVELCDAVTKGWGGLKNSHLDANLKRIKMKSLLSLLFLGLVEVDLAGEDAECDGENHQMKIIQMVRQHISDTSGRGLTVDKLARIAGYSKFHFLRLFKKHAGQKVHDCINAARLMKIKEMLKKGCLQKEISGELGFSCPSAFSNWCRQRKSGMGG
jgi:AraC-like DNA-binding protein